MVSANGSTTTILKARFGNDVRRKSIHHCSDLTLNDLALMLQRVFSINSTDIQLKYRDSEGDFITIADDTDLLLALHEPTLFVEVIVGAESSATALFQQIQKIQEDVGKLSLLANSLAANQTVGEKSHKNSQYSPPSSPLAADVKSEESHDDGVITSTSDVSAPLEQDSFAPPMSQYYQPPQQQFSAPRQFAPTSNVPTPIQPEAQYSFSGGMPPAPGHFAPPPSPYQHNPGATQFAPPLQQFNAPPQFAAPPQMGGPPIGAPPMGAGMPGQNPFARGPGGPAGHYRQPPYHQ